MKSPMKLVAGIAAAFICVAPFAAGAVSIEDLQNQVASLLKQITQMQTQSQVSGSGTATVSGTAVASPAYYRACGTLNRNLGLGVRGDDVSSLQEFLQAQGYLTVNPSGYYGPLTAHAVAQWQASEGISAVGAFGPMSRDHLKKHCGSGTSNGALQVDKQSGSAPLTVTFTPNVTLRFPMGDLGSYQIDFGDGQTQQVTCRPELMSNMSGGCIAGQLTHTYQNDGTYTAVLETTPGNINPSAFTPSVVGKVQITVGGNSQGSVSATPSSGTSPLSVNFTYLPTAENGTYHIDYGDGSAEQMGTQQIYCIKAPCISPAVSNHTYTAAGSYTVVVSPYVACMYTNPRCMIAVIPLAKTTVTVTDGTPSTCKPINYMPMLCSDGTAPQPKHNESGCIIGYECPVANYTPPASCKAWNDGCNVCSRTSPDSPATCTVRACFAAGKGYCSTYFDNPTTSGNKPPVISGISGPTTLSVGQTGTWTVNASDPENGNLSYSITWGDETTYAPMTAGVSANSVFVQNTTFTHTYSSVGTFTVTVTVKDNAGQTAQTTTTVQVGGSIVCTQEYAPVCGLIGCDGNLCYLVPHQKTFSNRCMANAAGASQITEGACTNGN